jgi:hypothetical protein
MPYIEQKDRKILNDKMKDLLNHIDTQETSIGEMNFIISSLLNTFMLKKAKNLKFNYEVCNSLIGVLECAKLELYRKVIADYEDYKIEENGELYTV